MKLEAPMQQFQPPYALVVFPSDEHRTSLLKAVADAGMVPLHCESFEEAREAMKSEKIQVMICEDLLPEKALTTILKQAQNRTRPIPVIVSSRTGEWAEFLKALRQGAFDYLTLPPRGDEVRRVLGLALKEGSRANADKFNSGEAPLSEGIPLGCHFEDRWAVGFGETAPALSQPWILRDRMGEMK